MVQAPDDGIPAQVLHPRPYLEWDVVEWHLDMRLRHGAGPEKSCLRAQRREALPQEGGHRLAVRGRRGRARAPRQLIDAAHQLGPHISLPAQHGQFQALCRSQVRSESLEFLAPFALRLVAPLLQLSRARVHRAHCTEQLLATSLQLRQHLPMQLLALRLKRPTQLGAHRRGRLLLEDLGLGLNRRIRRLRRHRRQCAPLLLRGQRPGGGGRGAAAPVACSSAPMRTFGSRGRRRRRLQRRRLRGRGPHGLPEVPE
mmetsp:Transcript_2585/g.7695  ORF Transcript_2585/g.7695 Transcript_2585/m.7695 type:complete len:256 (-) Transcript_2585:46-813(-)